MGSKEWRQFFCANVRYLRKKYYLSQRSLAALLEISVDSLRKLEQEELTRSVTVYTIQRICLIFGVSTDNLFSEYLDPKHCADSSTRDGCEGR